MPQPLQLKPILRFRRVLFLGFLLGLVLPLYAMHLGNTTANYDHYGWWLIVAIIFLAGVEPLFGKGVLNPSGNPPKPQEKNTYYTFLLFLCLIAGTVVSVYGAYFFSNTTELSWLGRVGWLVSLGLAISTLVLPAGHELIHREKRHERLIGGFLIAFVCNASLKIEHIRGHHLNAATTADTFTAKFNQSFYHFLLQALRGMVVDSWSIEKKRLNREGYSAVSFRNELIGWHLVSLGIAAIYYFLFGMLGIIFFASQGLIAITAHQIINYIQHYGLLRRKLDNGRYEKFSAAHTWSCNFLLSNMTTFCFPYHADHHLNPRRPYPLLQHLNESPQTPMGYFGLFFLALIPPLWFKVMNPRVLSHNTNILKASSN